MTQKKTHRHTNMATRAGDKNRAFPQNNQSTYSRQPPAAPSKRQPVQIPASYSTTSSRSHSSGFNTSTRQNYNDDGDDNIPTNTNTRQTNAAYNRPIQQTGRRNRVNFESNDKSTREEDTERSTTASSASKKTKENVNVSIPTPISQYMGLFSQSDGDLQDKLYITIRQFFKTDNIIENNLISEYNPNIELEDASSLIQDNFGNFYIYSYYKNIAEDHMGFYSYLVMCSILSTLKIRREIEFLKLNAKNNSDWLNIAKSAQKIFISGYCAIGSVAAKLSTTIAYYKDLFIKYKSYLYSSAYPSININQTPYNTTQKIDTIFLPVIAAVSSIVYPKLVDLVASVLLTTLNCIVLEGDVKDVIAANFIAMMITLSVNNIPLALWLDFWKSSVMPVLTEVCTALNTDKTISINLSNYTAELNSYINNYTKDSDIVDLHTKAIENITQMNKQKSTTNAPLTSVHNELDYAHNIQYEDSRYLNILQSNERFTYPTTTMAAFMAYDLFNRRPITFDDVQSISETFFNTHFTNTLGESIVVYIFSLINTRDIYRRLYIVQPNKNPEDILFDVTASELSRLCLEPNLYNTYIGRRISKTDAEENSYHIYINPLYSQELKSKQMSLSQDSNKIGQVTIQGVDVEYLITTAKTYCDALKQIPQLDFYNYSSYAMIIVDLNYKLVYFVGFDSNVTITSYSQTTSESTLYNWGITQYKPVIYTSGLIFNSGVIPGAFEKFQNTLVDAFRS